ncbi:MAG: hypothetical protein FWG34_04740 [Oscillospiraceae bacterium]|nr:hypothetical protein [Oscillospiraceae bacterium]
MNLKKIIILMALLSLLFSAPIILPSCGSDGLDTKDKNHSGDGAENTASDDLEESTEISDGLPDVDLGGYNFRINSYEGICDRAFAEDDVGEVINDAQYRARLAVEDRFNVKISLIIAGGSTDGSDLSAAKKSILTADDAFDLLHAHDITLCTNSLENIFMNLYDVPNLDFSKPWWPQNSVDSLTILGQMYAYSNSMTTDSIGNIRVLFINKDIAQNYAIATPYKDVLDGIWTIDKLTDMTKDVYSDLNGDGEADENDLFGFEYRDQYFICTLEPLGITPYKRDAEEIIKLDLNNERTLVAIDKMYALLFGQKSTFFKADSNTEDIFMNGRALATCLTLGVAVDKLRFTEINYGILPMPKLEASQKNYTSGYTSYLFAIPNTAQNLERTGVVIEALSAEGHKKVLPAYYEIALKNKYLQDEESILMLDLINESKMLDLAWCYNVNYAGPYWFMRDLFIGGKTPSTDFASWYDKNEKKQLAGLETIITKFENMQGGN